MNTTASLDTPDLRYLKGVGPKRVQTLEKIGVRNIHDLLYYFPRRHEDRSQFQNISEVTPGSAATLYGEILTVGIKRLRRFQLLEVVVGDETQIIHAVWFNQTYLKKQFQVGQKIIMYGKVDFYQKRLQINSPEFELIDREEVGTHAGRITPIYPLTEGLYQKSFRATLKDALEKLLKTAVPEFLPESYLEKQALMPLQEAVEEMHFPSSFDRLEDARKRIVHDEFLIFEISLLQKMKRLKEKYQAHAIPFNKDSVAQFKKVLPFELTKAQVKALDELARDLAKKVPMNRLLQGDVGSGKTVTATFGLWLAAQDKLQSALLVPTEVLAQQHYRTLLKLLEPHSVRVSLLTSNTEVEKRAKMLAELKRGEIDVLVGTHAILQDDVIFSKLAFLVIDEQHKFGVYQRCRLLSQNPRPHQLVMTATPIPRTLALTVYGDLEVSVLNELPKGRQPIKTYWITRQKQDKVLDHIHEKILHGDQAYFIFPLIEETQKSDLLAATREYKRLQKTHFAKIKMGLVHGKLSAQERDATMKAFSRGEIKILVATSVIEVGVDNPNATIMVIENAERFGLSQLHQMRGRIGRGSKASECFLFGEPTTQEGQKRLRILTKTQDGFVIAEEDLKLRGPGDFLGTRQSGAPLFKVANASQDYSLLLEVRQIAMSLIESGSLKKGEDWAKLRHHLQNQELRY